MKPVQAGLLANDTSCGGTVRAGRPGQYALEYRFRRADGSYIWVSDTYASMVDDAGQIIAWLGILVDITAQKEASDAIARLAAIVEASDDAIFSRTQEGIITYWNPAAERLYGYTAEEAVGQSLTMLFQDKGEKLLSREADFAAEPSRRFESTASMTVPSRTRWSGPAAVMGSVRSGVTRSPGRLCSWIVAGGVG